MYLIETKVFHSSAFPALFYLTLVLSTILIWSTTSLGYGGDRAYADSSVFTRIAKSWVGPRKRLRIHLIWLVSWTAGHETIIWCEWSLVCCYPYTGLMGLVSYLMSLVIYFMRSVIYSTKLVSKYMLTTIRGCGRLGHKSRPSVGNPLIFHLFTIIV